MNIYVLIGVSIVCFFITTGVLLLLKYKRRQGNTYELFVQAGRNIGYVTGTLSLTGRKVISHSSCLIWCKYSRNAGAISHQSQSKEILLALEQWGMYIKLKWKLIGFYPVFFSRFLCKEVLVIFGTSTLRQF